MPSSTATRTRSCSSASPGRMGRTRPGSAPAGFAAVGTFLNSYTADKYDGLMRGRMRRHSIGRDVRVLLIAAGAVLNLTLPTLWLVALLMNVEVVRRIICWRQAVAADSTTRATPPGGRGPGEGAWRSGLH